MLSASSGSYARKCTLRPTVPSLLGRTATHVKDSHIGKLKSPLNTEDFDRYIHEHAWHARCFGKRRSPQGFFD